MGSYLAFSFSICFSSFTCSLIISRSAFSISLRLDLYRSNLTVSKRERYIAYIWYGGLRPAFKFNLKTCKFEHPYKFVKQYYYGAYSFSNDFYEGVSLGKKWAIQDNLMKNRPEDDNFYRGFEKFEQGFQKYFYKKYEDQLKLELEKNGASKSDYGLISTEMILNSIMIRI